MYIYIWNYFFGPKYWINLVFKKIIHSNIIVHLQDSFTQNIDKTNYWKGFPKKYKIIVIGVLKKDTHYKDLS